MTMTTEPTRQDPADALVEALFADARAAVPPLPEGLLSRVLVDAEAAMPRVAQAVVRAAPVVRIGWLEALVTALGGRGAVAGMAAVGLAGVWIGFAQPVALPLSTGAPTETVNLYPADLDLLGEFLTLDASEG